jgi:hypothetical protein
MAVGIGEAVTLPDEQFDALDDRRDQHGGVLQPWEVGILGEALHQLADGHKF